MITKKKQYLHNGYKKKQVQHVHWNTVGMSTNFILNNELVKDKWCAKYLLEFKKKVDKFQLIYSINCFYINAFAGMILNKPHYFLLDYVMGQINSQFHAY